MFYQVIKHSPTHCQFLLDINVNALISVITLTKMLKPPAFGQWLLNSEKYTYFFHLIKARRQRIHFVIKTDTI